MFAAAEQGQTLDKKNFKAQLPALRQDLLTVQRQLREKANFPVIVLFAGVDGAGKHETVSALNEWMDPRWIVARAYDSPSDEERERPEHWRFWRDLPPKGQIGLFLSAWYSRPFLAHANGELDDAEFAEELDRINALEQSLVDNGALIVKFWLHLNSEQQRARFKSLEADSLTAWQVKEKDWANLENYSGFIRSAEQLIKQSSTEQTQWHIIDGYDSNWRSREIAQQLHDAIQNRLSSKKSSKGNAGKQAAEAYAPSSHLANLDMSQALSRSDYRQELKALQAKLHHLQQRARAAKLSTTLLFEGPDAAGKGGAIRRIIHALDARHYQVIPIAAPTSEELAQHYLWRFWRHIPRAGRMTIFDRSWYGRVLVERVEGFAQPEEWQRAYAEINQFEAELVRDGGVLCKFWLHIDQDEQLKRFNDRENIPHKAWKLTDEDWRNREQWAEYERAVNELVDKTSTAHAPWTLVEANQKWFARVKVLRRVCEQLEEALA